MKLFSKLLMVILCLMTQSGGLFADVNLPAVIGSNMVLQQDKPVKIWGWADPGESVTVIMNKKKAKAKADEQGKWKLSLPSLKAGGPYTMTVKGKNEITLENIMVGEVWLCSGQSNMERRVRLSSNNVREVQNANYPNIRLFHVPRRASGTPLEDVDAEWKECNPLSVYNFSAVSYFFGRKLHKDLNVPIGLIATAWGGTSIEPWTPLAGFQSVPELNQFVNDLETAKKKHKEIIGDSLSAIKSWLTEAEKALMQDKALPKMPQLPVFPQLPASYPSPHKRPTALYNGQVHALVPFSIRGAIWYQGEANRYDGFIYFEKMKALIQGWRKVWGQGDFPFYYVQLAPFSYTWPNPVLTQNEDNPFKLSVIREAQRKALSIPNTGMVVTTDIGNLYNIHPPNKQEVARRLALWALAKTYDKDDIVYSGPLYKSMSILEKKIRVEFDFAESGLLSNDENPLTWFEIAGSDKKFVRAQTFIKGNAIEVWSAEVLEPVAVRFGWHEEANPNLINNEGLPASPFNTETE